MSMTDRLLSKQAMFRVASAALLVVGLAQTYAFCQDKPREKPADLQAVPGEVLRDHKCVLYPRRHPVTAPMCVSFGNACTGRCAKGKILDPFVTTCVYARGSTCEVTGEQWVTIMVEEEAPCVPASRRTCTCGNFERVRRPYKITIALPSCGGVGAVSNNECIEPRMADNARSGMDNARDYPVENAGGDAGDAESC